MFVKTICSNNGLKTHYSFCIESDLIDGGFGLIQIFDDELHLIIDFGVADPRNGIAGEATIDVNVTGILNDYWELIKEVFK